MILVLSFSSDSDREKFEAVYERYKHLMLHKAHQVLHSHALAEDAVSEAFLRIYRNLDKIGDPASSRTAAFVATIARNAALTLLDKERRGGSELLDETLPDECDVEAQVLSDLSTQGILALMEGLSEELRSPFLLRYAYDMSHREIGRALGISENNVTVRIHRARKKLSVLLGKEGHPDETR